MHFDLKSRAEQHRLSICNSMSNRLQLTGYCLAVGNGMQFAWTKFELIAEFNILLEKVIQRQKFVGPFLLSHRISTDTYLVASMKSTVSRKIGNMPFEMAKKKRKKIRGEENIQTDGLIN